MEQNESHDLPRVSQMLHRKIRIEISETAAIM